MRHILLILSVFFLTGCQHLFGSEINDKQRHQICERIEYKLNFDDISSQQNVQPSALERARLLSQHRQYGCSSLDNSSSQ